MNGDIEYLIVGLIVGFALGGLFMLYLGLPHIERKMLPKRKRHWNEYGLPVGGSDAPMPRVKPPKRDYNEWQGFGGRYFPNTVSKGGIQPETFKKSDEEYAKSMMNEKPEDRPKPVFPPNRIYNSSGKLISG